MMAYRQLARKRREALVRSVRSGQVEEVERAGVGQLAHGLVEEVGQNYDLEEENQRQPEREDRQDDRLLEGLLL